MIKKGQYVSIEYAVTLDDGTLIDTNSNQAPLVFVQDAHDIFPSIENALRYCTPGNKKIIILRPEEAYGHEDPERIKLMPLSLVPKESRYPGAFLSIEDNNGKTHSLRVEEIKEDRARLNFNHPLAGLTLHYSITVLEIADTPITLGIKD